MLSGNTKLALRPLFLPLWVGVCVCVKKSNKVIHMLSISGTDRVFSALYTHTVNFLDR